MTNIFQKFKLMKRNGIFALKTMLSRTRLSRARWMTHLFSAE